MDEQPFFPFISRPGRYLGCEFNLPRIDIGAEVKWALVFPDLYEIGMSHQGLQILYQIINDLSAEDKGVILISSEMPELLGLCDRTYVMNEGAFVGELAAEDATQERIMSLIVTE